MNAVDLIRIQQRFSYIILCYAIDSNGSFENLDEWVKAINSNTKGQDTPIALAATKSDLVSNRQVSESLGW